MSQTLVMPSSPVFWRRRTAAGRAGILLLRTGLVVSIFIGLIEAIGAPEVVRVYAWTITAAVLVVGIMRAVITWRRGGAWECRIEDETLTLTRPGAPPLIIEIADIRQWTRRRARLGLNDTHETRDHEELALRGGEVIRLNDYPFGRFGGLRKILRRLNPEMRIVRIDAAPPATIIAMRSAAELK